MQMSKRTYLLVIFFAWTVFAIQVKAQDEPVLSTVSNSASTSVVLGVSEVSLIKTSADVINLQLKQQDAGMSVETSASDSTARLLISSVISTSQNRILSAKITAGSVPTGTHLNLTALQPNANFAGDAGKLMPPTTLDGTDRPIITDIATCYSGTSATDGYMLKFNYALDLNPTTYGSLRASLGTQVVVTFTLTAVQ
jgi:hypothetical protein